LEKTGHPKKITGHHDLHLRGQSEDEADPDMTIIPFAEVVEAVLIVDDEPTLKFPLF